MASGRAAGEQNLRGPPTTTSARQYRAERLQLTAAVFSEDHVSLTLRIAAAMELQQTESVAFGPDRACYAVWPHRSGGTRSVATANESRCLLDIDGDRWLARL